MTATIDKYRAPHVSERLLPRTASGFNGCRVAATYRGTAYASLGESLTMPNGKQKGAPAYRADLARMRKLTREPNADGFNQSHLDEFAQALGYPTPPLFNKQPEDIWDALDDSVISVSGNPRDIAGASELERLAGARGWPNVNHQLLIEGKRVAAGKREVLIGDPMVPQAGRYNGDWVPWSEMVQFMRSQAVGGSPIAERFTIGAWTEAAQVRRRKDAQIEGIEVANNQIAKRLRTRITELEAGGLTDCAPLIADAKAATVEKEMVALIDYANQRRT